MNTPSLTEVLIVALAFGIVGTYVLSCRHFINASEAETQDSPKETLPVKPSSKTGSSTTRHVHA